MVLLFAPLLSLIAAAVGGVASIVAFLLNGRRWRRRGEPPMVVLPPIPSREELRRLDDEDRVGAAL